MIKRILDAAGTAGELGLTGTIIAYAWELAGVTGLIVAVSVACIVWDRAVNGGRK